MNEPWRFIWLSDAAIVYAVNVLMAASVACAAGLAADVALRRRSLPLRHGVLQAALVAAVASLGLVHVAQRQGNGWIALDLPAAIGPRPGESSPAGDPAPVPAVNAAAADVTERVVPRAIGPCAPLAWMRGACGLAAAVWLADAETSADAGSPGAAAMTDALERFFEVTPQDPERLEKHKAGRQEIRGLLAKKDAQDRLLAALPGLSSWNFVMLWDALWLDPVRQPALAKDAHPRDMDELAPGFAARLNAACVAALAGEKDPQRQRGEGGHLRSGDRQPDRGLRQTGRCQGVWIEKG
jgi:hypothetical protein